MTDFFQIGVITSTHGIRGEVKIFPTTDNPKRFEKLKKVLVEKNQFSRELTIQSVKYFKQFVILKFKEYDSINDIEFLKQGSIQIPRNLALPLEKDEYYITDLIGLKVLTEEDIELGILKDVLLTGSNEVYVVELTDGKEVLLPAIKECILEVNTQEGYMKVHVMEGLMD